MAVPHIEIKSKKHDGNGTIFMEIFVDGHKLTGVRRFELRCNADEQLPTLTVDLNAIDISVDTELLRLNHYALGEIKDIIFKGA